jgi:hypothetical protein
MIDEQDGATSPTQEAYEPPVVEDVETSDGPAVTSAAVDFSF